VAPGPSYRAYRPPQEGLAVAIKAESAAFKPIQIYGWMPHNASFGFLDIARPTLGQIHF
jgi:hypothetical protein